MGNIVELKTRSGTADLASSPDLRALRDLQAICAEAIATGGLDAARTLDFTVAVHRVLKGNEWRVRFYRGQPSELPSSLLE